MGLLFGSDGSNPPKKLKISAFKDAKFSRSAGYVVLQINPDNITHDHRTKSYDSLKDAYFSAEGSPGEEPVFKGIEPQGMRFDFILDATGVLDFDMKYSESGPIAETDCKDIVKAVKNLKKVLYAYNGDIHGPHYLKITWGELFNNQERAFRCRLERIDVTYTLFKPDGTPLRAKVDVSFQQYLSQSEIAKLAKKSSPDMSHVREVREFDTLSMMCFDIYGTSDYYLEVARINKLTNIHRLKPGTKILFPPLQQ